MAANSASSWKECFKSNKYCVAPKNHREKSHLFKRDIVKKCKKGRRNPKKPKAIHIPLTDQNIKTVPVQPGVHNLEAALIQLLRSEAPAVPEYTHAKNYLQF